MAEDKLIKNITIDELADMIQKGFAGQDKRFDKIEQDLTTIKGQLVDVVYKSEFNKLENRVADIENLLAMLAKKT